MLLFIVPLIGIAPVIHKTFMLINKSVTPAKLELSYAELKRRLLKKDLVVLGIVSAISICYILYGAMHLK